MAKDAYYFSHDSNARRDPKILALRNDYGTKGYGAYWIIVEMLAEQEDYKLKHKQWVTNAIAMEMQCETIEAETLVNDCIDKYELFESDNNEFWSNSLMKRMQIKEQKRKKKAEAGRKGAQKRWNKEENIADEKQSDSTAIDNQWEPNGKNSKGKESKVKESKVNIKDKEEEEEEGENLELEDDIPQDNKNLRKVISVFNNNIHPVTPMEGELIVDWVNKVGPEVIIEAIKESVKNSARSMKYIEKVLMDWDSKGINTKEKVVAHLRDYEDKKKGGRSNAGSRENTTKEPDQYDNVRTLKLGEK